MAQEQKEITIPTMPPAKEVRGFLDLLVKDQRYYMATLAPGPVWFDSEQRKIIAEWFSRHNQVLGVTEVEAHKHYHVMFCSTVRKTGNVTRALENLFTKNSIPWTKGVTINVKYCSVPIGTFYYLTDPQKKGIVVFVKGWRMSWIQEICRKNLKSMPKKLLTKDMRVVNDVEGPDLIIKFANRHHMPLVDKTTFIQVVARMIGDKYVFHKCKMKHLISSTLAINGHMRCVVSWLENELHFIEG